MSGLWTSMTNGGSSVSTGILDLSRLLERYCGSSFGGIIRTQSSFAINTSKQRGSLEVRYIVILHILYLPVCVGYIPCVTQSDLGTENYNVAYAQTTIRHHLDPGLVDTIQHRWVGGHRNIKPEQAWSRFRSVWTPGYEALFDKGIKINGITRIISAIGKKQLWLYYEYP
jgi:hypothetical protein